MPPFTLSNEGTDCYANAVIYSVWIAARHTSQMHHLHSSLRNLAGAGVRARRSLGFFFMGWPRAQRQHDVAEFADFLLPRVVTDRGESWCGRSLEDASLRVTEQGPLSHCLPLQAMPYHSPDIQELILHWHRQQSLHAFVEAPAWLHIQLPRFQYERENIIKLHHPFLLPGELQFPVFQDATSMSVAWRSYQVAAIIRHHGDNPRSGHYTVLVRDCSDFVLDDDAEPKIADQGIKDDTSTSMYIVVACRSDSPGVSRAIPNNPASSSLDVLSATQAHGSSPLPSRDVHASRRPREVHTAGTVARESAHLTGYVGKGDEPRLPHLARSYGSPGDDDGPHHPAPSTGSRGPRQKQSTAASTAQRAGHSG